MDPKTSPGTLKGLKEVFSVWGFGNVLMASKSLNLLDHF